jgi:hypothetical protein
VDDAVGIGLRRPDIVTDRLGEWLARSVQSEDHDDLARLRFFDQVAVVETPIRGDVGAETFAGMAGAAARPRTDVEDAHLEDIAGLGALDRDRSRQQMHADAFARAANEWAFGRAGAAPRHGPVLTGPVNTLSAPGSPAIIRSWSSLAWWVSVSIVARSPERKVRAGATFLLK